MIDRRFVGHFQSLFDPQLILDVRARLIELLETERSPDHELTEREEKFMRIGALTDAARFEDLWYEPWRRMDADKVEQFGSFTWVLYPVAGRHLSDVSQVVPWHQDAGYQRLAGDRSHHNMITCFTPLEADPAAQSTLEFCTGISQEISHYVRGDHGACIDDPGGEKKQFALQTGDAIVFGDLVPHRTIPGPDGKINRCSFEYRLTTPDDALDDKDYFDLKTKMFVRTDGSRSATL